MKKILIADDHNDIRRLIRITLGNNYEIFEASDGENGLRIIRQEIPDLVVLDIMMPGQLDGLQLLDIIKSDQALKHINVLLVTARGQIADREEGIRRGATEYFVKPFSPLQLITAIKQSLL